jgi:hypothetical protein
MTAIALQPGICRHCKCTEENACILQTGEPCCWMDRERLVCSNPACIKAEARRVRLEAEKKIAAEKAARRKHGDRFVGMGYGAIVLALRRDIRRRRRQGRAP